MTGTTTGELDTAVFRFFLVGCWLVVGRFFVGCWLVAGWLLVGCWQNKQTKRWPECDEASGLQPDPQRGAGHHQQVNLAILWSQHLSSTALNKEYSAIISKWSIRLVHRDLSLISAFS